MSILFRWSRPWLSREKVRSGLISPLGLRLVVSDCCGCKRAGMTKTFRKATVQVEMKSPHKSRKSRQICVVLDSQVLVRSVST